MSDVLLPFNATAQELALEQATARVADVPLPVRDTADPDTCPAALLPWLAWAYSVDEWDPLWSETQKRESIKAAAFTQRYKGTIGAVREALGALGYDLQVQEWFNQDPPGPEYTFRLYIDARQVGYSQPGLERVLGVVDEYKNLRSHLETVIPSVTTETGPIVAAVTSIGSELTVEFIGDLLLLDGTWNLDGSQTLNGIKIL